MVETAIHPIISTLQIQTLEDMAQQRKILNLEATDVYALIEEIKEFLSETKND